MRTQRFVAILVLIGMVLAGCMPLQSGSEMDPVMTVQTPVTVDSQALTQPSASCSDTFVVHELDHVTSVEGDVVRMFDSNGAGLGINDLDNDGDLDLVLANLAGVNVIFWNEGDWRFRRQPFPHGDSRAVTIVDVNGDGWHDVVFSRRLEPPTLWRNVMGTAAGDAFGFAQDHLPGVAKPAYAIDWGDWDQDGDLDLVTASYDQALEMALGDNFRFGSGAGIRYYEQLPDNVFASHFLARHAQTLALLAFDFNRDGWLDILAGNDFVNPDNAWAYHPTGWQAMQPFSQTTQNTMSLDAGDIDNDGTFELFAADMKPYDTAPETLRAWQPVMDKILELPEDDPQVIENVLLVRDAENGYENRAVAMEVDATGWSWSAKFGDLDNDGFLDLYVVNGMAALDLFDHLPDNELVEENQALRNVAGQRFVPAPQWNLNATTGGRGMSMADLDRDGDLDIVVNNLLSPTQIFENQLCGGASVQVDLHWPTSKNTRALGARLALETAHGTYHRDVRSASGYLSGDPARVHFGVPADGGEMSLQIVWPDGETSRIDRVAPHTLLTVTR